MGTKVRQVITKTIKKTDFEIAKTIGISYPTRMCEVEVPNEV